jgi:flavin-binding protein dodecin
LANSDKSCEDAAKNAIKLTAKCVKNIRSVYVNDQIAIVKGAIYMSLELMLKSPSK